MLRLTAFGTAITLASALSLAAASPAAAQDITVWAWDMHFNGAAMEAAAARFAETRPEVTVTVVDFAKPDLEQKLQAQLASNTVEGLPDIVLIEDYGAQKFLQAFPGAFEPLTEHVDYSQFAEYKVSLATLDGETYALPFDSGVTGWFYRSDILAEAGYTAADLTDITWSRFIEIAKDVAAKTGHPMIAIDINDPGAVIMMLHSAGSWYFGADGSVTIADNPSFLAALDTYQRILQTPEIWKPVSGWSEYTGAFTAGEVASVFTGVWITGTVKATGMEGKWSVAPLPRLDTVEGAVNASNYGGSSWYVLASSPNKDLAIEFLASTWGGNIDFYQPLLIDQGAFATYLPAQQGPAYSATDPFFGGQAVWQDFSTWQQRVPPINYGIFSYEADAALMAQLPALAAGAPAAEIAAAVDAQVRQQAQ
jgi:lactose/L-arabinose transport system substrate-binding protein